MASQSSKTSPKKNKLVRDSFTIPKTEYAAIEQLKTRAIALGTSVKKSELLRAGLMLLQGLSDAAYKAAMSAVPTLKTGRPAAVAKPPAAPPAAKRVTKPQSQGAAARVVKKPATSAKPKAPTSRTVSTQPVTKSVARKAPPVKAAAPTAPKAPSKTAGKTAAKTPRKTAARKATQRRAAAAPAKNLAA